MARSLLHFVFALIFLLPVTAAADVPAGTQPHTLNDADRMYLARQFLAKIKPTLESAYQERKQKEDEVNLSNVPEGEELFFRVRLTNQIALDYQLLAVNQKGHLLLSFKDFVDALELPIKYDSKAGTAQGWYIRETKIFQMNVKTREVTTDNGTFKFSGNVQEQDGDLVVPSDELGKWFGFELKPNVPQLEFQLVSKTKLPVQEKIERRDRIFAGPELNTPTLPPLSYEQKMIDYPFVDMASETRYNRPGNGGEAQTTSFSNVRTSGDFAHGTLSTQSQLTREEKLTNVRINYKKESLDPELLGPLKARRFELGDVTPVQVPISQQFTQGVGARVTNKDSLRSVTGAYTDIAGFSIPGWDAELYRGDQLLGFQTVGDDGQYRFPKVDLFGSDNTFRVVLYGLQGEIREEEIYIPVDPKRLADAGSAYDVSIVRQDTQTYNKLKVADEDDGAPSITALYEIPVGESSAITTGLLTRQDDGNQKITGIAGLSTTFAETLWNFNTAVDNRGEMAGEMIARKDIGKHQLRNETRVATDRFEYETPSQQDFDNLAFTGQAATFDREVIGNEFSVNGPLDIKLGRKPRYNMSLNYSRSAEGLNALTGTAGFSATFRPLSFNQQLIYEKNDSQPEDTINALTNLNGTIGRNRIRLTSDVQLQPEVKLDRVAATIKRTLSPTMDVEGGVQHLVDRNLTEVSTRLNWDTGYGNVSPGISYNTDRDLIATLTTRFGLAREPKSGDARLFDRQITTSGGVSAFVFLDKDGDNVFSEGDEPIPDAIVSAPQNGGREKTDEKGIAFFSHMAQLLLTDVYVDASSLEDPYWIPAYQGASILPREGHIVSMDFPIHMSGEMDGTIYAKGDDETAIPVKGVSVGLYEKTGKKIMSSSTEQDGYYIFSKIPPGNYYLVVDDQDLAKDRSRPLPQPVKIGYEGTTIYANNIYLKQGMVDVPLSVLAGGLPYDPETVKPYEGRNFALNLGQYKSRLAMSLAWFKVKAMSGFALHDTDLIEKPSESIPRAGQSDYVLRLSVRENNLSDVYKKCGEIARTGNYCSVEILPGGLEQKVAAAGKL